MFLILKVASKTFSGRTPHMHKYLILLILTLSSGLSFANSRYQLPPDGRYKEHYPNGNIRIKGMFKNGQKQGNWLYYNEKRVLVKQERYQHGHLKYTRTYNDRGKLISVTDEQGNTKEVPCNCH